MKKKLPSNSIFCAVLIVFAILVAVGIPTYDGQTLLGAIFIIAALIAAAVVLFQSGRKKDARRVVGAEIYEDAKARAKNRANGVTTFSVEYQDGSRELHTVRDGSTEYNEYIVVGKPRH